MRMNNADTHSADIAWMLLSTALVLLMTPALAFFYGGLVRSKALAASELALFRNVNRPEEIG